MNLRSSGWCKAIDAQICHFITVGQRVCLRKKHPSLQLSEEDGGCEIVALKRKQLGQVELPGLSRLSGRRVLKRNVFS